MTHNTNVSTIERTVLRRARTIYALRLVVHGATLSVFAALVSLWGIGREVWVARVFQNAPNDVLDLPRFYLAAFTNTRFMVQILTLLTVFALLSLARATARLVTARLSPIGV